MSQRVSPMFVLIPRLWVLALLALVLSGCSFTKTSGFTAEDVVGTWYLASADGRGYEWQLVQYREDGRKCGLAVAQRLGSGDAPLVFESRWWLEADAIELQLLTGTGIGMVAGQRITDRILLAGGDQLMTQMSAPRAADTAELFYRVRAEEGVQVCDFVSSYTSQRGLASGTQWPQ